jgi:hypothetical protein
MPPVIGVDFDNTIAGYDELLCRLAVERGLLRLEPGAPRPGKKSVRDAVRRLPDGEVEWQKLQAVLYGPRMGEAVPFTGVEGFFRRCRARGARVFVISHKTEHAGHDETRTSLPGAARAWLRWRGFLRADDMGLSEDRVFFEPTRAGKIERARACGCTHFVDDLEETFLEPAFPRGVARLLFNPHGEPVHRDLAGPDFRAFADWPSIEEYFFGAR